MMKNWFDNKKILILGDSVTEQGDYASFLEYYLFKLRLCRGSNIISIGLASETMSGLSESSHPFPRPCLHERLGRALEAIVPDIVIACYGMNDGIYHPYSEMRAQAFRDGCMRFISDVHNIKAKACLITPPPFDSRPITNILQSEDASNFDFEAPYVNYDLVLKKYSQWMMSLEHKNTTCIDLHTHLSIYLDKTNCILSEDGIHPNRAGHLLIARYLLLEFGYTVPAVEDIAGELRTILADPLFKLIEKKRILISDAWRAHIGYRRETFVLEAITTQVEAGIKKYELMLGKGPDETETLKGGI